jgi:hypothetical protein
VTEKREVDLIVNFLIAENGGVSIPNKGGWLCCKECGADGGVS